MDKNRSWFQYNNVRLRHINLCVVSLQVSSKEADTDHPTGEGGLINSGGHITRRAGDRNLGKMIVAQRDIDIGGSAAGDHDRLAG